MEVRVHRWIHWFALALSSSAGNAPLFVVTGLRRYELPVRAAGGQQILVPAALHDPPLVHDQDEVRPPHRAQAVRDDDARAAQLGQRAMDLRLADRVERAG